ncbi:CTP synthase (glutamine hydrolyzing) [Candidatus Bathyarchaeota archaeon]|nr:MAG: CTP synthase (glutamine hydrolyzing) [Candidatus Bathyarchaeota archaeon]
MTKYVFVTGGVMSGIGKGVIAASIGKIIQVRGLKVTAVKIDPYLNYDAGTMNPYIHGEVFVTEDGGETDMDVGTYERFLDINVPKNHNITTGQVYFSVIERERKGDFLGKCVQIIPHITDEIKDRLRRIPKEEGVDLVLVEIGGTVGDIESLPYLEAARQLRLEEGSENVLNVHVTLVPVLDVVGEQKTKPTQHSVQELRRIGVQPDIIVARSKAPLKQEPRRKIALFCNVEESAVFTSQDMDSIYQSPLLLDQQGLGTFITHRLRLPENPAQWSSWKKMLEEHLTQAKQANIAICGKYAELADCYVSVNDALKDAGASAGAKVNLEWIETDDFERQPENVRLLSRFDGVLVPGGFGARGAEGKILAIEYSRSHNIPFLGICYGFQLAVVEYAKHIGIRDAASSELNPGSKNPVIDLMPEQNGLLEKGGTMRLGAHEITVDEGTMAHSLYGKGKIWERHRHRYEVNPEYISEITSKGLRFSGKSDENRRMEILEVPSSKFHFATQFHPEFKSRPARASPPYFGLIKAALETQAPLMDSKQIVSPATKAS